jgi:hypothetical protein
MSRDEQRVQMLAQKIARKAAKAENDTVEISVKDAIDIVFMLDLVRVIVSKTEEVMR